LDSARHAAWNGAWVLTIVLMDAGRLMNTNRVNYESSRLRLKHGGGQIEQSRPGKERLFLTSNPYSVLLFASLLAGSLASESGFHALFLAGLQVKGVTLDLLDNVFLLHLALEPAQSVL
jgi:hypothetical protein